LVDRIAIIERGIDGTSVYLIRISYFEDNKDLDLCNSGFIFIFSSPPLFYPSSAKLVIDSGLDDSIVIEF
jgi:hypothetical protein